MTTANEGKHQDARQLVQAMRQRAMARKHDLNADEGFQLPLWDDDKRVIPNDYARSALFTVRNKKVKREARENHPIFCYDKDVRISYTGIELRAYDDELVWQQVMDYAKRFPLGSPIEFTLYQLCQDLGWPINGGYYDRTEACLSRLQATAMKFESPRVGMLDSISMIRRFQMVGKGKRGARCRVEIDEEMIYLFAGKYYTEVDWARYRKLGPVARRLFDYAGSHKNPYPLKLETFKNMCASQCQRANKWAETVRDACTELQDTRLVQSAWVVKDLIHFDR
jgi:hypothetical protein